MGAAGEDPVHSVEKTPKENQKSKRLTAARAIVLVVATAVILYALYDLSQLNYLLFHSAAEIFSIVIAFAIFAIAWNTRRITDNRYFLFIGIAFAFVAGLDLFHMLAYKNMGVFPNTANPNLATQLWIATRYLLSFSLLLPLLFTKRKIKPAIIVAGYGVVTVLLIGSIFLWQNFPLAYDINANPPALTAFKVGSEYAISIIILVAIGMLIKKRKEFSQSIYKLLLAAMMLAVATEMAFTLYTDVYGIMNIIGHLLNVVFFYFIYRALIGMSLTKPYDLLFRNLKQSETSSAKRAEELTKVNQRLEEEIAQHKATQRALQESEERLRLKLDSVLSPDVELDEQELANIIDVPSLQDTMDRLYLVTNMTFALLDLKGNVLVANGWQDICTKFHRVNPQTYRNCVESDLELSRGVEKGQIRLYKCKNNMWDIVTPLYIGDKHVGNIFSGQFLFDNEDPDQDLFAQQAEKYGFNKEKYLAAFSQIPRYNRENIQNLMVFYAKLSEMISKTSYANIKLAKALNDQKELQGKLEEKAAEVEEYATNMESLAEERAGKLKDAERLAAIGATAGMVGHDIRNPLQAIETELYFARRSIARMPQEKEAQKTLESIETIGAQVDYISKIVADLQDYAKPLKPELKEINLSELINSTLFAIKIPDAIALTVDVGDAKLQTDPVFVRRALTNLINNAIQAMPEGGKLTVNASQDEKQTTITVQDTGKGIPEEAKPKLFTPLFTTKAKGQGFGLAVTKRLIEALNGTIALESGAGKGTKFIIELPAQ